MRRWWTGARAGARARADPARPSLGPLCWTALILSAIGLLASAPVAAALVYRRVHGAGAAHVSRHTPPSADVEWIGSWEFSEMGADPSEDGGSKARIPFRGTEFALIVRRGPYRGHLYVAIDGEPASCLPQDERGAYLVLTSPNGRAEVATIPVGSGLSDRAHVAEIIAVRGWDQWPLVGWQSTRLPERTPSGRMVAWWAFAAGVSLLSLAGSIGLLAVRRAVRRSADPSQRPLHVGSRLLVQPRRRHQAAWLVAVVAPAVAFYFSPYPSLTIVAGVAMAATVLVRLDLGLALVAGVAPFYLKPRPLGGLAFSMAEICVLLCAASWCLRLIVAWQRLGVDGRRGTRGDVLPRFVLALGRATALDLAAGSFVLAAIASTFVADYRHVALRELRVLILEPALFYLMVRTTRLNRGSVWRLADFFLAGAVIVASIGLVQYVLGVNVITAEGGLRRLRSVYGSPNSVGLYLGRALPVLVSVALFAAARGRRLAYGLAALPVATALVLSFSRGALLVGVPASLLAVGLLAGGRWLIGALAAAGAAALAALLLAPTPRFAALFDTRSGTTFFRLQLWQSAWDMFRDHPWLGVGPDNFLYSFRGRYIRPAAWQEPHISQAHNIVLDYATRLGIPGLVTGIWLQVGFWLHALPLRRLRDRDMRALALGLMGSMVSFLAHGLVDASYFLIDLAYAFFLTLGLAQVLGPDDG